jgi:hypothetical protein
MKNKIFYLLAFLFITQVSFAQVTKKVLELPEFKSIYVNSAYTVYLKQTNKNEVTVEAITEVFNLSKISVENGILMVNIERKPDDPNKSIWAKIDDIKLNPTIKLYVSMKNVNELQVNGPGKIISENSIAADYIFLAVNGSGSMDIDLKGNNVKAEVTGSGTLGLKGYATSIDALVSGNGLLKAFDCPLESAKIKVSGNGGAEMNVTTNIEATVMGSGTVKHKGNTKNTQKKIYGPGSIERAY